LIIISFTFVLASDLIFVLLFVPVSGVVFVREFPAVLEFVLDGDLSFGNLEGLGLVLTYLAVDLLFDAGYEFLVTALFPAH
jgi:hypothetical protein